MSSLADLGQYINALFRYRLVSLCTIVVGLILTVWTVRALPDVYSSTTLIMVEPQDVPESYVHTTVTERLESRLQAMNQEVLSRTRLETIINDLALYPQLRANQVPMEDIVGLMRRNVTLQIFSADNAFRITYEGTDPATVQRVTTRLANLYIDENLRMRESRATGTTEFMESELEKARKQLEQQEGQVQAFKHDHLGELPEQRDANMRMLDVYQSQLRAVSTSLSRAQERKLLLEKQAGEARSARLSAPPPGGQAAATSPAGRLRQLQAELAELQGRYTDEHPDVVRIRNLISHLQEELGAGDQADGARLDPLLPPELARSLIDAQLEISRLRQEEEHLKTLIGTYQQRVENAFVREQQMESLTRDYEVTQKKYQTLLDKKLEAQLSQSLEQRQKAERFRVIDPASLPQAPTRPNRQALLAGGAVGSFALAIFLPILLWQLDTSFHVADELAAVAVPVLAVIPEISTADVSMRRRRYRRRVLALSVASLILGLSTVQFYAKYLF